MAKEKIVQVGIAYVDRIQPSGSRVGQTPFSRRLARRLDRH